jgi:hypothetical protein
MFFAPAPKSSSTNCVQVTASVVTLKTGAVYVKHRLVESFWTEKGSRHRTVTQLGCLDIGKADQKKLACILQNELSGDPYLLDFPVRSDQHLWQRTEETNRKNENFWHPMKN